MGNITGTYQCPACSRPVTFRAGETRILICGCGQVLRRQEDDTIIVKPALILQDHGDLLQVGATGVFQDKTFELLGRFRVWLDESVYNYWTILFGDGTLALLAEGYGMYAVLRQLTLEKAMCVWDVNHLASTDYLNLLGEESWFIQRKDACWKYEIEGEVWMPDVADQFKLFDMYARGDGHIEFIECHGDKLEAYAATYVPWSELQMKRLNEAPPTPKEVYCSQCHTLIKVKTFPYAQSCSCASCGARLVFNKGNDFRGGKKDKENKDELSIPLGATGVVKGITYEVIGYALKEEDSAEAARWKEYVLYNRAEGYAFLSEYCGTWIYAREHGNSPVTSHDNSETIYYKGEEFDLYNRYTIRLIDTAGEFPFNIFDDQSIVSAEFIAPPFMWVMEKSREGDVNWFWGEHQDRKELLEQFPYELPEQTAKGVLNPKDHINVRKLILITLVAVGLITLVHFFISMGQNDQTIFDERLQWKDTGNVATVVTPHFTLNKWRSNLSFDLQSDLDNNWADVEIALVDYHTSKEYNVQQLVEYYHGYDDGESWDEGSMKETAYLSSIPAGTYFLRIEASRDNSTSAWTTVHDMAVTIKNDVPMHSNYAIFLGILLVWPVSMFFWTRYKDKQRWADSRFSPFNKEETSDE